MSPAIPFIQPPPAALPPPGAACALRALPRHVGHLRRAALHVALSAARALSPVPPAAAIPASPTPDSDSGSLPRGAYVARVRGDGRCLFRAIARGLAAGDARVLPDGLEREDADALRALAWDSVCVRRRREFVARHVVEGPIDRYCAASRSTTFYAGEPELLALADALRRTIRVYLRADGKYRNIATYGEQYAKRTKVKRGDGEIRVLYVNGNHYDAILPR